MWSIKKILQIVTIGLSLSIVNSVYYEPNYDIAPYLDDVTEKFTKINTYKKIGSRDIPPYLFQGLADDFSVLKYKLPQTEPELKTMYEACEITSRDLSAGFDLSKLDVFNAQCLSQWKQYSSVIFSKYAIQAKIQAFPKRGNAPLNVTLDARGSVDPSADTIPKNNYYWYYKDSNGTQHLIGNGPLINYTFDTANTYIVHLTVRSVNREKYGILDGSSTVAIEVAPPIANIVLYVNGQYASPYKFVKLSVNEGKNGVYLDANGTKPTGQTRIVKSKWIVTHKGKTIYQDEFPDYPGAVKVKMPEKGYYYVTIIVEDNTGKTIQRKYKIIIANPVALIKVIPEKGDTSTTFKFDASSSYSVNGNIEKYKWTIIGPNNNIIDSFEGQKSFKRQFIMPGYYSIKLEIEDTSGNKNVESYKLFVDSTKPVANFVYRKFDNWEKPSTFVFDAGLSYDYDEKNGDTLSYSWYITNSNFVKTQKIEGGKKMIAQFNKKGEYKITLSVKDKYGKLTSITKKIKVKSTLRPKLDINPNYTVLGNSIGFKVHANKPVGHYYFDFGDSKNLKTQQNSVSHKYEKAGVFNVKVTAYGINGEENSITKKVFIGQKGYPIGIYKVTKNGSDKPLIEDSTCSEKNGNSEKIHRAFTIDRGQNVVLSAKDSINGQGTKSNLKIYFKRDDEKNYINRSSFQTKFQELGCKKITLYVRDLNTNKIDKKDIYFKIKNAKPTIKDIKMYFPQYGGRQSGTFQPRIGTKHTPKDIFTTGFDPLLVKIVAIGAKDKDSSILSYYRWYYYRKGDRENPVRVKNTPYNIPEAVFAVPRIPGEYIFGVDVCDVDDGCTNSEDYLHLKPVVNIPASSTNPNIPQVNSVRIDTDKSRGVGDVNVGEEVTIVVNTSIPSKRRDFSSTRTIKYDFDGDGVWDLVTKKTKVKHIYQKPFKEKKRVKVMVIYRGMGGIGYSDYFIVKKGVKILVDMNAKKVDSKKNKYVLYGKDLLFNNMSFGNIKERLFCFDVKRCKKEEKYLFKVDDYGHVEYDEVGTKKIFLKVKDAYGNASTLVGTLSVKDSGKKYKLLTLPRNVAKGKSYSINVSGLYTNYFILYYKSDNNDCYIDKNIISDSDGDGNAINDKDLECNKVYKLEYKNLLTVLLKIYDGKESKTLKVNFDNVQVNIPKKYKGDYEDLLKIISKYSDSDDDSVKGLISQLGSLVNNLDDKIQRDEIITNINSYIDQQPDILEEKDMDSLKLILDDLSDYAVNATKNLNSLEILKGNLEMYTDDLPENKQIMELISKLEKTTNIEERRKLLNEIYKIVLDLGKQGKLSADVIQGIKKNICDVMKDYNIKSKACGTELKETTKTSTTSKILKIVGYFALILGVLFVITIIVFVIKAKQRREEQEETED